jgi:hypothetical protein
MVDQNVGVLEHEISEHGVDLGGYCSGLRVAADARDELTAALSAQEIGNRAVACTQDLSERNLNMLVLLSQPPYQLALSHLLVA